jgi:DNA-binding SARP family transcriptional activator
MGAQRLVVFLVLHEGLLLRQHVAGSLWPDTTEQHASGSLPSALWRLGQPTHPVVEVVDAHLRLSRSVAVDVHASEALARRILGGADLDETDLDARLLADDLLPDWTEDWVQIRSEQHTQLRLRALETLCRRLTGSGRFGQAVQVGMVAVAGEPLRESAQRALIAAHLADGNVGAAVGQYRVFARFLRSELGLEPSPAMQTLMDGLTG